MPSPLAPTPLLDNTHLTAESGRYVAHVAVPCRDVLEAADWYSPVIGAGPVRISEGRVTLSVGGISKWSATSTQSAWICRDSRLLATSF